ncbi:cyclic nucleotide-binding and patatin-like phospholipase domain-containing protein [Pseudorhodoferax sp.]|uniref:cyclic nucleotide-binding and patatin-like phospholipase domain-containing protein n=1 Tax=Pseudorhodoferax sp. TaxID=1993553 RepID=UPI002DD61DDB|nr:cyclic nucleotide-binding and patatin-like phospholipase domain-containing protein [Pseudorhodoferax sp.]
MVAAEKFQARALQVLRGSRIFGQLDEEVLHDLARFLVRQDVPGGHQVLREGAPSDSMLILLSGRLRVSRTNPDGSLLLYNEISVGEGVGETGMILQQPRTADVTAVRDSTLAVLHSNDFEALLKLRPLAVNRVFSQAIYNHLRHGAQVTRRSFAQSFVVVPLHLDAPAGAVARALTEAFAKTGRARHLPPVHGGQDEGRGDALDEQFDHLVYEAEAQATDWTRRAFRQADQVIYVARAGGTLAVGELEQQLAREPGYALKRKHLVVMHAADAQAPQEVRRWLAGRACERVYPLRAEHVEDFARLARFLTGTAVGVVLGGGGARGYAHLGILRALHEAGIPIDMVGGNSMGALVGAQYACDVPLDEIMRNTQAFAAGGERLTLPLISLVSGFRVERDLRKMFGERSVDSLWRPFFAAACNLSKGHTTVQDTGPLWKAVLASNSPAGLFPPVLHKGDLLVDGAILENVPVDAMRMRLGTPLERRRGNGTIIAIDVDVQEDLRVEDSLARLSRGSALKGMLTRQPTQPGIVEILYRAGHIGGLHQRAATVAQADHYLEPPVAEYSMMDHKRAPEIVEAGYRYAVEKISQWTRP